MVAQKSGGRELNGRCSTSRVHWEIFFAILDKTTSLIPLFFCSSGTGPSASKSESPVSLKLTTHLRLEQKSGMAH
jgi:hypothetical protein